MSKKHDIAFGDLVLINGYGNRPFYVDGWQTTYYYEPDAEWTDTLYDLTCAHTGEYDVAYEEDIKRICSADQAEDYLEKRTIPIEEADKMTITIGGESEKPRRRKPTRNPELEKQRE